MAADANAIRAGRAFVEIFADSSQLTRDLAKTRTEIAAFVASGRAIGQAFQNAGRDLFMFGSIAGVALGASLRMFSKAGDEMINMSQMTNITVERLSALKFAADRSNTSIEAFATSIGHMNKFLTDVAGGDFKANEHIKQLGLTLEQFRGLTPDKQFERFADAIAAIQNPAERSSLAMTVFGRAGKFLLPLMLETSAGIKALSDEAESLGVIMSTKDASAGKHLADAFQSLWDVVRSGTTAIGSILTPALTKGVQEFAKLTAGTIAWAREHKALVQTIVVGVAAFAAAGASLFVFGKALSVAYSVLTVAATPVRLLIFALQGVAAALTFILSPLGLVTAGVVALGAYIVYASGNGGRALKWLGEQFQEFKGEAIDAWDGITAALAGGDLAAAVNIGIAGMKLEWVKFKNWLLELWINIKTAVAETMIKLSNQVTTIFKVMMNSLENHQNALGAGITNIVDSIYGKEQRYTTFDKPNMIQTGRVYSADEKNETIEIYDPVRGRIKVGGFVRKSDIADQTAQDIAKGTNRQNNERTNAEIEKNAKDAAEQVRLLRENAATDLMRLDEELKTARENFKSAVSKAKEIKPIQLPEFKIDRITDSLPEFQRSTTKPEGAFSAIAAQRFGFGPGDNIAKIKNDTQQLIAIARVIAQNTRDPDDDFDTFQ